MERIINCVLMIKALCYSWYSNIVFKRRNPLLLGRMACLGVDVTHKLGLADSIFNIQKGRIDLLARTTEQSSLNLFQSTRLISLAWKNIVDKRIFHLIVRSKADCWKKFGKPKAIIFDTYSELTDQKFVISQKLEIFCSYSDILPKAKPKTDILSEGLLSREEMRIRYFQFANWVISHWGAIPIYIIIFPIIKEDRMKFINQNCIIIEVLKELSLSFQNINIINLSADYIYPTQDFETDFRYHFSEQTKSVFSYLLKEELEKKGII